MGEGAVKKSIKKRKKDASTGSVSVVCTANSPNSNNIELGLIVALMILGVYVFGFYESVVSVPATTVLSTHKDWIQHLGQNLNVARSEFNAIVVHHGGAAAAPNGVGGSKMDAPSENKPQVQQQQKPKDPSQVGPPPSINVAGGPGKLNMPVGLPEDEIVIPKHKWPISIWEEKDDFEPLIHSGDWETVLQVPKLWSLPIHNYKLMTRERALQIGSCSEPDDDGNFARGDKCPVDLRTIYVGIASYRDFECRTTVEDIFSRAKNPDRIRVGK